MVPVSTLLGYKAALVLLDSHGDEYEVRNGLVLNNNNDVQVDINRVAAASDVREADLADKSPKRPVY